MARCCHTFSDCFSNVVNDQRPGASIASLAKRLSWKRWEGPMPRLSLRELAGVFPPMNYWVRRRCLLMTGSLSGASLTLSCVSSRSVFCISDFLRNMWLPTRTFRRPPVFPPSKRSSFATLFNWAACSITTISSGRGDVRVRWSCGPAGD